MTQHTDEPSDAEWDELRDIINITYDKGVDPRDFVNTLFAAGYRKVSRLSHPTLSAQDTSGKSSLEELVARIIDPIAFDLPGHTNGVFQTPQYLNALRAQALNKTKNIIEALRSRLQMLAPTLSAERLAEIQKRHEADYAVLCAHEQARAAGADPGYYDISVSAHNDRAELLAAHRADRNAVIEEAATLCDRKAFAVAQYGFKGQQAAFKEAASTLRALKQ